MTVIDSSVGFDLAADHGTLSLDETPVNAFIAQAYGLGAAGYTGPLNVQIVDARIVDPSAKAFAVMGFAAN